MSDFAFLIVAPALVAALLPAAIQRRRGIALVAVAGLFAAAKLSASVSGAVVLALRHAGISWRLWPDPTDLMALVVLPLSARLMRLPAVPGNLWRLPRRAAVILGAMACIATSGPPRHEHNAFLLNAAPDSASISITWLLRRVPCPVIPADEVANSGSLVPGDLPAALAASLTPGDLDDPIQLQLDRGQVAPLDGAPPPGVALAGTCSTLPAYSPSATECVSAILDSPPAQPVLMVAPRRWDESDGAAFFSCENPPPPLFLCEPMMDPTKGAGADAVTLKEQNGRRTFVAGAKVRITPVDLQAIAARPVEPQSCRSLRDQVPSLLASQSCSSNADCFAVQNVAIPGFTTTCGADLNVSAARALHGLESRWSAGCVSPVDSPACSAAQPAVCRAGACGPACPGEDVPGCPVACYEDYGTPGAACDTSPYVSGGTPCARPHDIVCNCVNRVISCGLAQPVSSTCPLTCLGATGGSYVDGSVVFPSWDAGASDAGRADGGAAEAGSSDAGASDARD